MRFCIIGHPVSHSKSPELYNRFFKLKDIDADYKAVDISPDTFEKEIKSLLKYYDGLNVTIPFKERIINFIDNKTEKSLGAVNCIYRGAGYNTDWLGFIAPLRDEIIAEPVLVIGAGGAAQAAVYAMKELKVSRLIVVNRTLEKAERIKLNFEVPGVFEVEVLPLDDLKSAVRDSKTVVNTTSVGMKGECFDIAASDMRGASLLYDIIYWETPLARLAKESGVRRVIDGSEMLLRQAQENLKLWGFSDTSGFEEIFREVVG